jgi:hypothetical protein
MKFIDCFHINYLASFYYKQAILFENRDKRDSNNRIIQPKMYIIRKKREDPEFFKNCLELNPFSEN